LNEIASPLVPHGWEAAPVAFAVPGWCRLVATCDRRGRHVNAGDAAGAACRVVSV